MGERSESDRQLLLFAAFITLGSATFAALLLSDTSESLPALRIIPAWMMAFLIVNGIFALLYMAKAGIRSPISHSWTFLRENRRTVVYCSLILMLAGMNKVAFMWVKPVLNHTVPFWADPLLSDLDRYIFFGHDPWRLLQGLNFSSVGVIYHPVWFGGLIIALSIAIWAPRGPERSSVVLSYFLLWSFVGPTIHCLLPAGGPIFFERLGYGPRYAGLDSHLETAMIADYLWSGYNDGQLGVGSGISAMPSMHVTMSAWLLVTIWKLARPLLPFAIAFYLSIVTLSMSLGWHYALDGIVGTLAASLCYHALATFFRRRLSRGARRSRSTALPARPSLEIGAT